MGCLNSSWHTPGVSDPPVLLGITKWLAWVVEPPDGPSSDDGTWATVPLSTVSPNVHESRRRYFNATPQPLWNPDRGPRSIRNARR